MYLWKSDNSNCFTPHLSTRSIYSSSANESGPVCCFPTFCRLADLEDFVIGFVVVVLGPVVSPRFLTSLSSLGPWSLAFFLSFCPPLTRATTSFQPPPPFWSSSALRLPFVFPDPVAKLREPVFLTCSTLPAFSSGGASVIVVVIIIVNTIQSSRKERSDDSFTFEPFGFFLSFLAAQMFPLFENYDRRRVFARLFAIGHSWRWRRSLGNRRSFTAFPYPSTLC
jgi:hypothetical protein